MTPIAMVIVFLVGIAFGAVLQHAAAHQQLQARSARIEILAGELLTEVGRLRSTDTWRGITRGQGLH